MKRSPNLALGIGSVIGILVCIGVIGFKSLSTTESLLVSVLLTMASILGSWELSRFYAEQSFNENLRIFALKAAEKVNNLSNELDRLSAYLQQELDDADYTNPAEELLAKEFRIEGAIHVIHTLKSVNDGSLSDWQGVIGKELDEQREEQVEREEELRELVQRVEGLYTAQATDLDPVHREWESAIRSEVNTIRGELRLLTSQVGGVPLRRPKIERQNVSIACPHCAQAVDYSQKVKESSVKALRCDHCQSRLLSRLEKGHFTLRLRTPVMEAFLCPHCQSPMKAELDPMPGAVAIAHCGDCGTDCRVARSNIGINVRETAPQSQRSQPEITEEVLRLVKGAMPAQPWPSGAAREAALELGLQHRTVSAAIQTLMERGDFAYQINGRLYRTSPQAGGVSPASS
jgi:hypothetical protein